MSNEELKKEVYLLQKQKEEREEKEQLLKLRRKLELENRFHGLIKVGNALKNLIPEQPKPTKAKKKKATKATNPFADIVPTAWGRL